MSGKELTQGISNRQVLLWLSATSANDRLERLFVVTEMAYNYKRVHGTLNPTRSLTWRLSALVGIGGNQVVI